MVVMIAKQCEYIINATDGKFYVMYFIIVKNIPKF